MDLSSMTFPLTVNVSDGQYWIGDEGLYKLGMAATEFLADGSDAETRKELEGLLRSFGFLLSPFANGRAIACKRFDLSEHAVGCAASYGYRPIPGGAYFVERYTFTSLRDFLFVELGKGILYGNVPRQCRLCGRWERGRCSRRISRTRALGRYTSAHTRNTTPAS